MKQIANTLVEISQVATFSTRDEVRHLLIFEQFDKMIKNLISQQVVYV